MMQLDVARVRLYLMPDTGNATFRYVRPGGVSELIPALRLRALVNLTSHVQPGGPNALRAALPECVIDTGSPLSVISQYIWSHFIPGIITRLPFDPAMPQIHRSTLLGGGKYPYELGELTLQLRDRHHHTMDVRIIAQLTLDNGALTIPMILGLRGGVIDGRILRAEPDQGAPFGQAWILEDP
jgi:hypothetical protein